MRIWLKWCQKRQAVCDYLLLIHSLLKIDSNNRDEYEYKIDDLYQELTNEHSSVEGHSEPLSPKQIRAKFVPQMILSKDKEEKGKEKEQKTTDEQDSDNNMDDDSKADQVRTGAGSDGAMNVEDDNTEKFVISSDVILLLLTELDRFTFELSKKRKQGSFSTYTVFETFRIDLKMNTFILCIELLNTFVLSYLKLNNKNKNATKNFRIPQAFGNREKCNDEYFLHCIISLLRVFIAQCEALESVIGHVWDPSRLPDKLKITNKNNGILNKLKYLNQMLIFSNVFEVFREKMSDDADSKSVDIGKELSNRAQGLCFDLIVTSHKKKLHLGETMLKQCVENCKVCVFFLFLVFLYFFLNVFFVDAFFIGVFHCWFWFLFRAEQEPDSFDQWWKI